MAATKTVTLNSGYKMPLLGLGCWQSTEDVVAKAVETALDCGYRHIDTAYNYLNEDGVGDGIQSWLKKTGNSREDVFIVTKLPMLGMNKGGPEKFLKLSLKSLKLDYIDLYLVHVPVGVKGAHDKDVFPVGEDGKFKLDNSTDLIAIWKEMENIVDAGLAKSIGISNFDTRQLKKILANCRIPPAVQQVEMHLFFQQKTMQNFCKTHDITMTAYAPLGSPGRANFSLTKDLKIPSLLEDPVIGLIAENHKVTSAQVLIKFWAQSGVTVIPKSVTPSRIKTNGEIFHFELSELEMNALRSLDRGNKERTFDMKLYFDGHPECPLPESEDL